MNAIREGLRAFIYAVQHGVWFLLGRLLRSDRLWQLVDHTGIVIFVGPNGSGKSLAAVRAVLSTLLVARPWTCLELAHHHNEPVRAHWKDCEVCERDLRSDGSGLCPLAHDLLGIYGTGERLVYSTVPLRNPDGTLAERYRPLTDFRQLVTIEHAEVLFDEVAGVSDSSDSAGVPVQVTNWLHQLRKRDVRLRVTTPAYARCSKPIRQVAQVVVDARSFFPVLSSDGRLWRSRQAMLYSAFDAFAFADYTPSTHTRIKAMARCAFWRPGSIAQACYDTLGAVLALGHTTESGMCALCGGARSRPRCGCDGARVDVLPLHELAMVEKVSGATRTRMAVPLAEAPAGSVPLRVIDTPEYDDVHGAELPGVDDRTSSCEHPPPAGVSSTSGQDIFLS